MARGWWARSLPFGLCCDSARFRSSWRASGEAGGPSRRHRAGARQHSGYGRCGDVADGRVLGPDEGARLCPRVPDTDRVGRSERKEKPIPVPIAGPPDIRARRCGHRADEGERIRLAANHGLVNHQPLFAITRRLEVGESNCAARPGGDRIKELLPWVASP